MKLKPGVRPLIGAVIATAAAMISAALLIGTVRTVHVLTLFFGGAAPSATLGKAITEFRKHRT
jgi:hypothetical protein